MMIRSIYCDSNGQKSKMLTNEQIQRFLNQPDGLLWVSLENTDPEEAAPLLKDIFHFHFLAIEDCMSTGYQTPKVDDYGEYIFIIAHAIQYDPATSTITTLELNFFLAKNYLVTVYRTDHMPPVEHLWTQIDKDERLTHFGSDFLLHGLLDYMIDDFMPVIDALDDEIEWLEDQVIERPVPNTLERIISLKHALISLRRVISPQREVMNRLSRDEFPMIDSQSRIYFRDVYDHLVRFQDLSESLRDIVSGAMDIYLNSTSLRLNNIMKALTVVSTIFLPLTFIAGVYGMNFEYLPELHWRYGYLYVWFLFLLIGGIMLVIFRRRKWF